MSGRLIEIPTLGWGGFSAAFTCCGVLDSAGAFVSNRMQTRL